MLRRWAPASLDLTPVLREGTFAHLGSNNKREERMMHVWKVCTVWGVREESGSHSLSPLVLLYLLFSCREVIALWCQSVAVQTTLVCSFSFLSFPSSTHCTLLVSLLLKKIQSTQLRTSLSPDTHVCVYAVRYEYCMTFVRCVYASVNKWMRESWWVWVVPKIRSFSSSSSSPTQSLLSLFTCFSLFLTHMCLVTFSPPQWLQRMSRHGIQLLGCRIL